MSDTDIREDEMTPGHCRWFDDTLGLIRDWLLAQTWKPCILVWVGV
jgi:hypothetical protein